MIYFRILTEHIADKFGAQTYGPVILMRPKYKDDVGLLEHEKTHVWQFWRTFGVAMILNLFRKYRLQYEVEAYRAQLKANPPGWLPGVDCIALYASFLVAKYDLGVTQDQTVKLLTS